MEGSIDGGLDAEFIRIMAETMEIDPGLITHGANLREELGADSADMPMIAVKLEDHYGVELPDDVLKAKIVTVGDLYNFYHPSNPPQQG